MNTKIVPLEKTCVWCSAKFLVGGRGRPPRHVQYCSRSCSAQGRTLKPVVADLSVPEAAYLAGIIDGEGSVLVMKRPPSTRLSVRVVVVNTDEALMDWLEKIGGNRNWHTTRPTNFSNNPKPIWSWVVNGHNAVAILRQVLPYMIIKKAKAEYAISTQPS
jgi:hypothetical protein